MLFLIRLSIPRLLAPAMLGMIMATGAFAQDDISDQAEESTGQLSAFSSEQALDEPPAPETSSETAVFMPQNSQNSEPEQRGNLVATPCLDPNSNLCQQWRIAEASEKAALVTVHQFWFAVAGFVVSILAVLVAGAALFVSWSTGRKQTRAYLTVSPHAYFHDELHEDRMKFGIRIVNNGSTPAYVDSVRMGIFGANTIDGLTVDEAAAKPIEHGGSIVIGGGDEHYSYVHFRMPSKETLQDLAHQRKYSLSFGIVKYRDVYGQKRRTRYFFQSTGEHFAEGHSIRRMPTHNDGT